MKYAQRLDDARLAEVLHERGMADLDAIREMLQAARAGGTPFCEAVVSANLVHDWDLSRVVAEMFQLPFLPVDICRPDRELWGELESPTLRENSLVPLSRFGQVLTLAMPGLVSAEVLGMVTAETDLILMPVVGTVETNRRWIEEHATSKGEGAGGGDWGSLFDQADAAVQADLGEPEGDEELDLDQIEFTSDQARVGDMIEPPSLVDSETRALEQDEDFDSPIELPPIPEFE